MKLRMTLAVAALLMIGLSSAAAYADTVNFSLTNPNGYIANTGGSLTYEATVSAPTSNTGDVYLNGDSFNITAPLTLDDSDFFADAPLFLAPGESDTFALFTVTMPPNTAFETFLGTFTLLGGADPNASGSLGTVNFSVTTTPEPSSIFLLLTGAAGLFWAGSRKGCRALAR